MTKPRRHEHSRRDDGRSPTVSAPSIYTSRIGEKPTSTPSTPLPDVDLSGLPAIRPAQADKAETSSSYLEFDLPCGVFARLRRGGKEFQLAARLREMALIVNQYGAND
jgi:hypothetical protein